MTLAALALLSATPAPAIETMYGEDPVPDAHRSLKPPFTAYGMDPIPVQSPLERWQEFRAYRATKVRPTDPRTPADANRWKWWHRVR